MKQTGKNTYNSNMVGTKKWWAVGGQNERKIAETQ